jgi:hypothetical protein
MIFGFLTVDSEDITASQIKVYLKDINEKISI